MHTTFQLNLITRKYISNLIFFAQLAVKTAKEGQLNGR
jgi:hypothetical protein